MPKRQAGFTMLEVMVAITITSLLLVTVYGIVSSVSSAKERLERDGAAFHQARVIFDRIGREVRSAYVSASASSKSTSQTTAGTTRFKGGEDTAKQPYLEFSSTATSLQGGSGGIVLIRYRLTEDPEKKDGSLVLMRRETPLFQDEEEGQEYRLSTDIDSLRFRFYDGQAWQDEWVVGLPQIIEVNLTVRSGEETLPFRTAFEVANLQ